MKKFFAIFMTLFLAASLRSAVTLDSSASFDNVTSAAFDNTGSYKTMMLIGIFTQPNAQVESVTYNGVFLNQQVATGNLNASIFWFALPAPATGTNTIYVNFVSMPADFHFVVGTYDGVAGIGATDSGETYNSSITFGGESVSGSWSAYLAGAYSAVSAPSVTNTAITIRQSETQTTEAYIYGDTTFTASQTFMVSGPAAYSNVGVMVELQAQANTPTVSPTTSPTFSVSPTNTPSATPTPSPTPSWTPTITLSSTKTFTPTISPTFSNSPVNSATLTKTPTITLTPSPTPSNTPTWTPTWTPTATPTATQTIAINNVPGDGAQCVSVTTRTISGGIVQIWLGNIVCNFYKPCSIRMSAVGSSGTLTAEITNSSTAPNTQWGIMIPQSSTSGSMPGIYYFTNKSPISYIYVSGTGQLDLAVSQ